MSSPVPRGYAALTPYLCLNDAEGFVTFASRAFGAEPRTLRRDDEGRLLHGEVVISGCLVELSEANDGWAANVPAFHLFVEDPDSVYRRALEAGAESVYPPTDHEYGERSGGVKDPWGGHWYVAKVIDPVARGQDDA